MSKDKNTKIVSLQFIIKSRAQMLDSLVSWLVDIGMAVGPIMGYVSQYMLIKASKSVGSFSIDICGILLFANILRLNFYIFKQYQSALFFQSIFMIAMQMLLLYECCKHPNKDQDNQSEEVEPTLSQQNSTCAERVQQFWRWKSFEKFGVTVLFFAFCTLFTSLIFKITPLATVYGQLVGLVALMSESILILPQILRNIEKQSTKGLSHMLVIFNLSGDIFKLVYFIINNQPFQFILCGIIQVILDSFVIIQIFYYDHLDKKRRRKAGSSEAGGEQIKQQKQALESQVNLKHPVPSMASQRENKQEQNDQADREKKDPDQMYEELTQQLDNHETQNNKNRYNEQLHESKMSRSPKKSHETFSPKKNRSIIIQPSSATPKNDKQLQQGELQISQ